MVNTYCPFFINLKFKKFSIIEFKNLFLKIYQLAHDFIF